MDHNMLEQCHIVFEGHLRIQQHHIWICLVQRIQRFGTVYCFSDDGERIVFLKMLPNSSLRGGDSTMTRREICFAIDEVPPFLTIIESLSCVNCSQSYQNHELLDLNQNYRHIVLATSIVGLINEHCCFNPQRTVKCHYLFYLLIFYHSG